MKWFSIFIFCLIEFFITSIYAATPNAANPPSWQNIQHVVVIILENTNAVDAKSQPFMKSLITKGAYLSQSFAITHPSQPNYIALVAGSTLGVTGDGNVTVDAKHLGDLFDAKGLSWKSYAENYPGNCYLGGSSGPYARKHEPFISFRTVQMNSAQCAKIVPAPQFFTDVTNNTLPTFSLYIPNLNNDGHDTGVAFADKWLNDTFGPLFNNPNVVKNTLFIVTFDEDDFTDVNQIYTAFVGAGVQAGAGSSVHYTHYNVLRTIEEIFGIGTLGTNDANAQPILDIWGNTPPPPPNCLPPANIQSSYTADHKSITLKWEKPANTTVSNYQVSDGSNNPMWQGTALTFTDNTLPGRTGLFTYFLKTICPGAQSASVQVDVVIDDNPPTACLPPQNIVGTWTPDRKSITLTWTAPTNSKPVVTYQVNDYLNKLMWKGTELKFTDDTLPGRKGVFRYYLYSNCATDNSKRVKKDVLITLQ